VELAMVAGTTAPSWALPKRQSGCSCVEKPVPLMVATVPPRDGPERGVRAVSSGGGTYLYERGVRAVSSGGGTYLNETRLVLMSDAIRGHHQRSSALT
jgi:hypothetical protein